MRPLRGCAAKCPKPLLQAELRIFFAKTTDWLSNGNWIMWQERHEALASSSCCRCMHVACGV